MGWSQSRILAALAIAWMTSAAAAASPLTPDHETAAQGRVVATSPADPCRLSSEKDAAPVVASWRARIDRRAAIPVVAHVRRACRMMGEDLGKDAGFAELARQLKPVLADLRSNILSPIYRSHPDLEAAPPADKPGAKRVYHATRRDIRRATAVRLSSELERIQQLASRLASAHADHAATREAALSMLQPVIDAVTELSFASRVAYDAYPDLFAKLFEDAPSQPRTDDSDASFRKSAPPKGSVKLSAAALKLVKAFIRQARSLAPRGDQVASISRVKDQQHKGPNDAAWINDGAGWALGAYSRTQLPPDVIDKVGGVEIVFSAEDPASLAGKTLDIKDRKFFVRD